VSWVARTCFGGVLMDLVACSVVSEHWNMVLSGAECKVQESSTISMMWQWCTAV
jgi:hypothetical protein